MAEHIQWRTHIARRIAAHYALHPDVEAVALIGSVALGWADEYSDIELAVFWRRELSPECRQQIAQDLGATNWHANAFSTEIQAWCEDYMFEGVKIDLGHWLTATMETIVADVVTRYDAGLSKQISVFAIQHSVGLANQLLLKQWQEMASAYPNALAEAMVKQHLSFSPVWMLRMLAKRDDFPLVRHNLAALSTRLFILLCALNHGYYPGHKWVARHISTMHILPPAYLARLQFALTAPLPEAVSEFETLVEDIIGLVDIHLPGVDTVAVRTRFNEQFTSAVAN